MGFAPSEFYRLQFSELLLILEGRSALLLRENQRRHEEAAWLGSIFLAPYTPKDGDPITPAHLLGRKPRKKPAPKFASPGESAIAFFATRKEKAEKVGVKNGQ